MLIPHFSVRCASILGPERAGPRLTRPPVLARLLVGVALLVGLVLASSETASAAPLPLAATAVPAPPKADQLERHLTSYLTARKVTASVRVRDLLTGETYSYRAGSRYDSASVVKVAIMAAVLRRQEAQKRYLTSREVRLLRAMIQNSDNDAASSLYASLGRGPALTKFYQAAGMTHTTPGPGRYWGLTQITAADQVVLLNHLARPSKLLNERGRSYARKLMASVQASQSWGVSAGPRADGARVELKNGWLSRNAHGWRVHSIGHVSGDGRDYLVAVLTMDNTTRNGGIAVVEGVSKIVWRDLAPAG
ncbi:MAG: serine hydrolase [Friedmanniella sp.]